MCRVIVVDDNPEHVKIATRVLSARGDDVQGFCDPFLALAAAIDESPDVVLVDRFMPLMDGTRLIKEMKKAGVHSKFILISASVDLGDRAEIRNGMVDGLLQKPVDNEVLYREIHAVL
jgi:CheY-like chemotaxis protein